MTQESKCGLLSIKLQPNFVMFMLKVIIVKPDENFHYDI